MTTKITLSGEVASGKTTIGKLLAERLNYEFISLGTIIREKADAEGLSIVDFQKKCQNDPSMDLEIDKDFSAFCNAREQLIIDYRMGFHFIEDAFHIYLKISEEDAVERLKSAKRYNESFETVRERNGSFKNQFFNAYQIDYTAVENFDLIITIEKSMTAEQIVDTIMNNLKY